jgi:Restriction endonuclease NaeI
LVAAYLLAEDPRGRRFAAALRRTIDMLLDGQHTGRYRWEELHKTEKTHAGTLVEINLPLRSAAAPGVRICDSCD